jgi:hypothetical protein
VLEVRERGAKPPEQAGDSERHAERLAPGRQLDRLDSVGNEAGAAGDRGEAEIAWACGGELTQEPGHVGLVTGALPAEDVGIEDD